MKKKISPMTKVKLKNNINEKDIEENYKSPNNEKKSKLMSKIFDKNYKSKGSISEEHNNSEEENNNEKSSSNDSQKVSKMTPMKAGTCKKQQLILHKH